MTTRPGPPGLGERQTSGSGPAGPAGTGEVTVAARRPPPARPWLAAGPPLLTLALALWGITGPSYWRDEAATLAATGQPFGRMIAMLGHVDAVHGAYYVLMWPVVRIGGTGELTTRLRLARRLWVVQIHEDRPVLLLGQLGFRLGETWREGDLRLALYARQGGRAA
ncbi:MAG TPA: hypothetical protein VGQ05_17815 [Streptosporangiaceae bacterium]|jgi:hypothetical protein|nr:hypothetical protein [Streptosporangiaceae bacterium]